MASDRLDAVDAVTQLSFVVHGALAARAADHDLSLIQTRLLGILRDRTPTMNELATLLELDKSSVTGLVARAERRGLVARAPSSRDGRSTVVTPTPAGRELIRTVSDRFSADMDDVLSALTGAERRVFCALAGRLVVHSASRRGVDLFDVVR